MLTRCNKLQTAVPLVLLAGLLLTCPIQPLHGDQGDPLAIRTWPEGVISIETHWGFDVVVNLENARSIPQALSAADLLITRAADNSDEIHCQLQPTPTADIDRTRNPAEVTSSQWPVKELSLYLDRMANESEQTLLAGSEATYVSKNAVAISHIDERLLLLLVDGIRVAVPLVAEFADPEEPFPIDVLILPSPKLNDQDITRARQLKPRWVVSCAPLASLPSLSPEHAVGNTLAVSHVETEDIDAEKQTEDESPTQWIHLHTEPWSMPKELADLFELKELACRQSQRTFAGLSVSQMNFKPANGTHTPRWNSEHMMGRELLFFSQIYAQRSPALKVTDLNPKQMPPDYEPKHDDWDGREEARQMERVSRFTRRFAYLLDGLELEKPAPGSSWTLSKLLKQMDKHYTEHTANVVKKFDLPEWPKE